MENTLSFNENRNFQHKLCAGSQLPAAIFTTKLFLEPQYHYSYNRVHFPHSFAAECQLIVTITCTSLAGKCQLTTPCVTIDSE